MKQIIAKGAFLLFFMLGTPFVVVGWLGGFVYTTVHIGYLLYRESVSAAIKWARW